VGSGGSLLSRDADVIVMDDIEDDRTTMSENEREKTRHWFANTIMSRKEDETALIAIGSRQHPDDLWGQLADNPSWEVIIEQGHDDAGCTIEDPDDPETFDQHVDCVLWPEVRPYSWLMERKHDPQIGPLYAMTYQNEPQDVDVDVFSRDSIDLNLDPARTTGDIPDPFVDDDGFNHPIRLVAGLDPAATGYQASFLWAVDIREMRWYAVDYENRLGGGIVRARDVIERWFHTYGCRYWVIEENMFKGGYTTDETLTEFCNVNGVQILGHETYSNKWDRTLGVTAMAGDFDDQRVSIPWAEHTDREKWALYRKQLVAFSRERKSNNKKRGVQTDIVMASWFPREQVLSWRRKLMISDQQDQLAANAMGYPFRPALDLYRTTYQKVS
ncbi:MAG: hypothetical protein R3324_14665, partial [Halobacteriales archaeon]|nr:hypothetical protein [Halobacteriales archaeon]